MKKNIRLIDHTIDRATNLSLEAGRFAGSITVSINGTPGRMTVNAEELLAAVQEILSVWSNIKSHQDRKSAENAVRKQSGRANARFNTNGPGGERKSLKIGAKAEVAGELIWRRGQMWAEWEDKVLSIVSPELAAEKLRRPLTEIHARLRELGRDRRKDGAR